MGTLDPVFVTTIYGGAYTPFLGPLLHSVRVCHPRASGLVLWQDVPRREVEILAAAFPEWRFEATGLAMGGEPAQRIPRKLHAWRAACERFPDRPVALLDCDTLVVRPLDRYFGGGWDVLYTWKDEPFPINTGVMLVRTGRIGTALFGALARRVEEIVRDPALLALAAGCSGAADQHALRELIGFVNYERDATREVDGVRATFRGAPCRELNETNCRPITDDLCVIHYKAGWHPILLDGRDWTTNRPEGRCREMFERFRGARREADAAIARGLTMDACDAARDRFASILGGYEERGILNSEMLAACAVSERLGAEVVIESGRCRGQSTLMLARYFEGTGTRVVSVELERDGNADVAEARLRPFPHVELRYGDSTRELPGLVESLAGRRVALLVDGPKGAPALEMIGPLLSRHEHVACAFLHDTREGSPARAALEGGPWRAFCTDDAEFVSRFRDLDEPCLPRPGAAITEHTWRPGMKGREPIPGYGPTLAVLLPRPGARAAAPASAEREPALAGA